jgi:hypothetical protein
MVMSTLTEAWKTEMQRSGVKPVWLVEMEFGPLIFISILDYTLVVGESLTITIPAVVSATFQEGVDFVAGASNTATAANLCDAINTIALGIAPYYYAANAGANITLGPRTTGLGDDTTVTSSNDAAMNATTLPRLPAIIRAVSGDRPLLGHPNSISSVSPISADKDVETQQGSIGDAEIQFKDDGWLREFLKRARPKGRFVRLLLGCETLTDIDDWAPIRTYVLDDFNPDYGLITLHCPEPAAQTFDRKLSGRYINEHPLAILHNVCLRAGMPASLLDTVSLDPTLYPDISHWAVTRDDSSGNNLNVHDSVAPLNPIVEVPAKDLIDELCNILDGAFHIDEVGQYIFSRFDRAKAVDRQLDEGDVADFEQVSTLDHIFNRVIVSGIEDSQYTSAGRFSLFGKTDTLAQILAGPAGSGRSIDLKIDSDFFGRWGYMIDPCDDSDGATFGVLGCNQAGISGTRAYTEPTTVIDAITVSALERAEDRPVLAAGRTTTLLIIEPNGKAYEYVECDFFAYDTVPAGGAGPPTYVTLETLNGFTDPLFAGHTVFADGQHFLKLQSFGRFAIKTGGRGLYGSSPKHWNWPYGSGAPGPRGLRTNYPRVYDVTIAKYLADSRLARFSNGCPIIRFRVPMRHYDLQIGDFISLNHRVYLNHLKDGSSSLVVWEIIGKEVTPVEDSPGIMLTCAWVRDDVALTVIGGYEEPSHPVDVPTADDVVTDSSLVNVTTSSLDLIYRG